MNRNETVRAASPIKTGSITDDFNLFPPITKQLK